MAQIFAVNGIAKTYIMNADWIDSVVDEDLTGQSIRNRWRSHRLQTNAMTAAEYDALFALQGQKITLTTTNYSDRNGAYRTYYDAEIVNIVAAHVGPVRTGVLVECRVRV